MKKSVIYSVSLPQELVVFLNDNPDLSLSKICQAKIIEIMNNRQLNSVEVYKLKKLNTFFQEKIKELNEKIAKMEEKNVK